MDENYYKIALASLLHDVGKFGQRAEAGKSSNMVGEYCPSGAHGKPTHLHVMYTDYFIEDKNVFPLPPELEDSRSQIARLASAHHKPAQDSLAELAISRADSLSAGGDRLKEDADTGTYKTARLVSIFDQIRPQGGFTPGDATKLHYYRLNPIEMDTFPAPLAEARQTGYAELYGEFLKQISGIRTDMGARHYLSSLVSLLERFTWCIPSNTYHSLPDISLFDHAMTTAAIAQALYAFHRAEGGMPGQGGETTEKFILFGGDLSGIQKYIFGVDKSHGSGVAKILRARSFYLQAITRSVIASFLDRVELLPIARIMDAGGRFVLLLPNTERVRAALPDFEKQLQQWFWRQFSGGLALGCSYMVRLTEQDMGLERFIRKLDQFNDHLEQRKLQRFDLIMKEGMSPLAELGNFDYDSDCRVCRKNPADEDASRRYGNVTGKEIPICSTCCEQITNIGAKLPDPDNRYLVLERGIREKNSVALFDGISMRFARKINATERDALEIVNIRDRSGFAFHAVAGHLPEISVDDLQRWQTQGLLEITETGFIYDGDEVAAGMPKTFNILAGESRKPLVIGGKKPEPRGKPFLGAFKADVDNLGFIFSIGLKNRLSISRFASLSRMLNHFFADYLVQRIRSEYPNIYIVFAGGDDLFLIGPWTEIIDFADLVQADFRRFSAENRQVTLSAGVAVIKPALPVHAIAEQAEELLEASKHFERNGDGKNAVTLFDTTVQWSDFSRLKARGEWFLRLITDEKITAGLARRLLRYGDDCRAFKKGDIKRGIYLSHLSYDFVRNIDEKKFKNNKQELHEFMGIKQDDFLLEHIRLPLSLALYKLRKN